MSTEFPTIDCAYPTNEYLTVAGLRKIGCNWKREQKKEYIVQISSQHMPGIGYLSVLHRFVKDVSKQVTWPEEYADTAYPGEFCKIERYRLILVDAQEG